MQLKKLAGQNFRNYKVLDWEPDSGLNILIGDNAQGKTNLLEAIHVLATGKSWRTSRDGELVGHHSPFTSLSAQVETELTSARVDFRLGKSKQICLNGKPIKRILDLLGKLLVVTFTPENLALAKGSPQNRRRFLDLCLSQVSESYGYNLSRYGKALEQRNSLLKGGLAQKELLEPWNAQLVSFGVRVMIERYQALLRLGELACQFHHQLSGEAEELSLSYEPAVPLPQTRTASSWAAVFRERLGELLPQERLRGLTLTGPQRDDFLFLLDGAPLRLYGSQGQQRTAVLALHLAAVDFLEEQMEERPILLLDDVLSELDSGRRERLLAMIATNTQTILTTTRADLWENNKYSSWLIEDGTICQK